MLRPFGCAHFAYELPCLGGPTCSIGLLGVFDFLALSNRLSHSSLKLGHSLPERNQIRGLEACRFKHLYLQFFDRGLVAGPLTHKSLRSPWASSSDAPRTLCR